MEPSVERRTCVAALAMRASGPAGGHGSVGEMRRRMTTRQNAVRETVTGAVRETGAARQTATGVHGCDICLALPRHAGSDQECHPPSPQERQSGFSSGFGRA
jgi:hypothetical protein